MSDNKHVHDEEMEIMTLTLDDDTELDCAVIGIFEVEEKNYIALIPLVDEGEEEEEVLIYEYNEIDEEEFELTLIEKEEDFELVSEAFYALYTEEDE